MKNAERIHAMILFDYVSNDIVVMTGRNPMKIVWNRGKVTRECAEVATSNDCCCNEGGVTDNLVSVERTRRSEAR
jgi:hypothetical protein